MSEPRVLKEQYLAAMRGAFEQAMEQVIQAVNDAPAGRVIRDSEIPVKDVLEEFRRKAYETAVQMRADSAESAFPPSAE